MSLRARFAAASSAVALVTSCAAFTAVWLNYDAIQERQLDAALAAEAEADAAEESYRDALGGRPPVLRRGDLGPITKLAAIYDASGKSVAWTPNLEGGRPPREALRSPVETPFDLWWDNRHLRALMVPLGGARTLWLATPRTDIDDDAAALARRMAIAAALSAAATALVTSWLARVLTRDHQRIAETARAVAAGDLSSRVGVTSGDAEMVQLGRDVDEMIARLEALVATQRRFIANASHELRSPLTLLLGELSFALRAEREAADYRFAIEQAVGSARRLKTLAEDLLELARAGASEVALDRVRLADVVRDAVASVGPAAEQARVTLDVACDGAVAAGRAADLERLVRNLVENAVRHSPGGGRVRIEARADGAGAWLSVADEGPGVPDSMREQIFEPFFRVAPSSGSGGAGLGLAIGRSIARAHGGDLWLDPASGEVRGARFVVRLPAPKAAEDDA